MNLAVCMCLGGFDGFPRSGFEVGCLQKKYDIRRWIGWADAVTDISNGRGGRKQIQSFLITVRHVLTVRRVTNWGSSMAPSAITSFLLIRHTILNRFLVVAWTYVPFSKTPWSWSISWGFFFSTGSDKYPSRSSSSFLSSPTLRPFRSGHTHKVTNWEKN